MKFTGIIPARYGSTRFPGKPLAVLGDRPVIQWVYEAVAAELDNVWVATDDQRIFDAVQAFGGKAVMTSTDHRSGTDRCYEAVMKIGQDTDVVLNVQGDEPFVHRSQLAALKACFDDDETQIATLARPFTEADGMEAVSNPNSPKVIIDRRGFAMYFSRSVIPFRRDVSSPQWPDGIYHKHIGLYAYRTSTLAEITRLPQSSLELAESLEQLRWLENGFRVRVGISQIETIGIDTPQDLERANLMLKK